MAAGSSNPAKASPGDGYAVETGASYRRYLLTAAAIIAERLAPRLLPACGAIAAFLIAAWLGLFGMLEPAARMIVTILAALAFSVALTPLLRLRLPTLADISRRIDRTRPDLHRPLATLADRPAASDLASLAIWRAHRDRATAASAALSAGTGDARIREKDRFAFRAAMAAALVASAFVAGAERPHRLAQAFDWSTPKVPPVPPRLDAWIDPPAYTGRPPLFLTSTTLAPDEVIRVPIGSTLTIRATAPRTEGRMPEAPKLDLAHGAGLETLKPPPAPAGEAKSPPPRAEPGVTTEKRIARADDAVRIARDGREIAHFRLAVIPDLPPKAILREARVDAAQPERQSPGGIRVVYALEDDYGIAKAELVIERLAGAKDRRPARTLFPPPSATIPLRLGDGEIAIPTEDHPWAGEEVKLTLRVEDDLGQAAESEMKTALLPGRPFSQALARALMEQRRDLTFSPDDLTRIRLAFDALLFEPGRFMKNIGDFMAMDMIRNAFRTARDDERLRAISEDIRDLALYIENGDMTEAERRLREAEARLRDAIERGAPPDEIRRLAEELRRAMDRFLREFAERALRDQDRNAQDRAPIDHNRMLTQRDLNDMLRKIEEMARSSNTQEAQRLLNELRQMLENLRTARRQERDPRMQELGRQLQELDRLQREQRDLRDRTFREGQRRRQQGQRGQQGEGRDLQEQQQALRERLRQLRDRLRQRGMQESEGFGQADEGMEDAEDKLGQGQPGGATGGQQRALDGLGRAAEGLSREMQRQMGEGEGDGDGPDGPAFGQPGQGNRGRADNRYDPLGRPESKRNDGDDTTRYSLDGETRGSISERAERVLRELRRRLGEFERPRDELDYLDRLLRQR